MREGSQAKNISSAFSRCQSNIHSALSRHHSAGGSHHQLCTCSPEEPGIRRVTTELTQQNSSEAGCGYVS